MVRRTTDVLTLSLCRNASILAVIKSDTDMDEQSNIETVETTDSGLTPSTIPGVCKDVQNGVSVRNMPAPKDGYYWYVFRASYGRAEKAAEKMLELEVFSYIAYHTVQIMKNGKRKRTVKPLIPGIIFAYLTDDDAELITRGPKPIVKGSKDAFDSLDKKKKDSIFELTKILSYYYDHFHIDKRSGLNPPLTIPYREMADFINATCTKKDVRPLKKGSFVAGDEVIVVTGEFKGLRGRVLRNYEGKKQLRVQFSYDPTNPSVKDKNGEKNRLCIQLPCLGYFSTASIPAAYFKKIE